MSDELQQHLDKGIYGTPLVNPDEQHHYLGTFRERVYITMTVLQMKNATLRESLKKAIQEHPDATMLLNGAVDQSVQSLYIKMASELNIHFTVVNDHVSNTDDAMGLVLTAKEAVNEQTVDIAEKYTIPAAQPQTAPKKAGFWDRLFHKEDDK